jgi:hypothetical protein
MEPNMVTLVVATIASVIVGFLWYSDWLFGKHWRRLMKISDEMMVAGKDKMLLPLIGEIVASFITVFIFGIFTASFSGSVFLIAFLIWLGFIATTVAGGSLWGMKSWKLFFIDSSFRLVSLLIVGLVFTLLT